MNHYKFYTNNCIESDDFFENLLNQLLDEDQKYCIKLINLKLSSINFSSNKSKCFAMFKDGNGVNINISFNKNNL